MLEVQYKLLLDICFSTLSACNTCKAPGGHLMRCHKVEWHWWNRNKRRNSEPNPFESATNLSSGCPWFRHVRRKQSIPDLSTAPAERERRRRRVERAARRAFRPGYVDGSGSARSLRAAARPALGSSGAARPWPRPPRVLAVVRGRDWLGQPQWGAPRQAPAGWLIAVSVCAVSGGAGVRRLGQRPHGLFRRLRARDGARVAASSTRNR